MIRTSGGSVGFAIHWPGCVGELRNRLNNAEGILEGDPGLSFVGRGDEIGAARAALRAARMQQRQRSRPDAPGGRRAHRRGHRSADNALERRVQLECLVRRRGALPTVACLIGARLSRVRFPSGEQQLRSQGDERAGRDNASQFLKWSHWRHLPQVSQHAANGWRNYR
jgi:hypothetical protein